MLSRLQRLSGERLIEQQQIVHVQSILQVQVWEDSMLDLSLGSLALSPCSLNVWVFFGQGVSLSSLLSLLSWELFQLPLPLRLSLSSSLEGEARDEQGLKSVS